MRRPPPSDFVAHGAAVTEMGNTNCWMMMVKKTILMTMLMIMIETGSEVERGDA